MGSFVEDNVQVQAAAAAEVEEEEQQDDEQQRDEHDEGNAEKQRQSVDGRRRVRAGGAALQPQEAEAAPHQDASEQPRERRQSRPPPAFGARLLGLGERRHRILQKEAAHPKSAKAEEGGGEKATPTTKTASKHARGAGLKGSGGDDGGY